nr:MAG TPA: hypothetical protein [Caudoviricetes sp.]DAX55753.1 MAG TPA: hypothetical protein [Caudoviricetes sp.]
MALLAVVTCSELYPKCLCLRKSLNTRTRRKRNNLL